MAVHVLHNPVIVIGNSSVDLTDHVESAEFSVGVGNVNVTPFGVSWEQHLPTQLAHFAVRLTFYQDYSSSQVYAQLYTALTTNATFPFFLKPTTSACSTANPAFTGQMVFDGDFNVFGGAMGDAHKVAVTLKGASTMSFITTSTS